MRSEFLLRALLPHLLFGLAAAAVSRILQEPGGGLGYALLLALGQLFVWYWTDVLLTGRVPGERMIRESKAYTGPDGYPRTDPESAAWFILGGLCFGVNSIALFGSSRFWLVSGIVIVAADLCLLSLAANASDAYAAFLRHVWPRLLQERRYAAVQAAREEADYFYDAHKDLLAVDFPHALWRASLGAAIPEDAEPGTAWAAARELIGQLQPIILRTREERRRRVADRRRLLDEVGRLARQIERVQASALDEDAIADEVAGLRQRMRQLEERLAMPDSPSEE